MHLQHPETEAFVMTCSDEMAFLRTFCSAKGPTRGYRTSRHRRPLLFEQQLDDHPLVRQVHARPVRRVDRNRL